MKIKKIASSEDCFDKRVATIKSLMEEILDALKKDAPPPFVQISETEMANCFITVQATISKAPIKKDLENNETRQVTFTIRHDGDFEAERSNYTLSGSDTETKTSNS